MGTICLLGFGRIGEMTAQFLRESGLAPVVFDASGERVRRAERLGFEAHLADVSESSAAERVAAECDIVATALPSNVAEKVLLNLISANIPAIVDVSYLRDPLLFKEKAVEARVKLFVDAGLAPGLSNMLATRACEQMDKCNSVEIYVGGIEEKQTTPLGLVASWSISDLFEEYTRKARARLLGRNVLLDPINDMKRVTLPGLGEFEALPTDGLRTLLLTLRDVDNLVEYTLRYIGHVAVIKMLREMGLLDTRSYVVGGCAVSPRDFFVKMLEERLPKRNDRVILYVRTQGTKSDKYVTIEYILDENQRRLGIEKPVLAYLTGLVHAWFVIQASKGAGHIGLNAPEELAENLNDLLRFLEARNVLLQRRQCLIQ